MFTATYTDVFSGNLVTPAFPQYSAFDLSSDITMSWAAQFQNTNMVVTLIMVISPLNNGFSVTLPDARQVGTGEAFTINNPTAFTFNLLDNTGGVITAVTGPSVSDFWLDSNETQAGTWTQVPRGGGVTAVTSVGAASLTPDLVITGSPITTSGTFEFSFAGDLLALTSLGASTGLLVRTAPNSWDTASIQGTVNQINVVNGSGVAGFPTIALAPVINGISSIALTNLSFGVVGTNVIASTNLNGNLTLLANGTGIIQLSNETDILSGNILKFFNPSGTNYISFQLGTALVNQNLLWPTTAATPGQVLQNLDGTSLTWASITTFGGPSTVNALARYSNITGSLKDSVLILDDAGNATGLTSAQIGDIYIGLPTSQTMTTAAANQDLIVAPNGVGAFAVMGNILIQPSSGSQRSLRLYNTAGTFYASLKSNAGIAANVGWSLPAIDSAGAFMSDGAGNMSITPVSGFTGASTINAIAKFSNITGGLENSGVIIDAANNVTGMLSNVVGTINLATNTISTTVLNQSLNLSPNGTGAIVANGNLNVNPTAGAANSLMLYNNAGTFYSGLKAAGALGASTTWALPTADLAGLFTSDGAGNMSITAFTSYFPAVSTMNAVPRFSNATGYPLKDSLLVIDAVGNATGLLSLVTGSINLATNVISTTGANQDLDISPNGTGNLVVTGEVKIMPDGGIANGIKLFNAAGTFNSSLIASAAGLAASTTWTLPTADSPGIMASNGAGQLTLNTIVTAPGTGRLGMGTDIFDANSTHSLTLFNGVLATSANASTMVFQSAATGAGPAAGTTLAYYGSGSGGVYASVAAASTNKWQVTINGTVYYIMLTTVA